MIAFIQARFTGAPTNHLWAPNVVNNWFDPAIPYSLAHFWKMTSFRQVDMSYHAFPPVELRDPRHTPPTHPDRRVLVEAVLREVDRVSHPDWNLFDHFCIFMAQTAVDVFGVSPPGWRAPNGRLITGALFSADTTFDVACQEMGHAFNLQHEFGGNPSTEYGCPYSVMSAPTSDYTAQRPLDPRLPGVQPPQGHPQRVVGPYVPAAHLYINQYGAVNPQGVFNHPDSVTYVDTTYQHTPHQVRLVARDAAIAAWPTRKPVLAVLPPIVPGGNTHFLELRRQDGLYDDGITRPAACVTILAANFFVGDRAAPDISKLRIWYVDRIDLEGNQGDLDYHSFTGQFVVRVNSCEDDFSAVNLTVGGGDAWKDFTARIDTPAASQQPAGTSEWQSVFVAPCPAFPKREYQYRTHAYTSFQVFRAHSAGYETPSYTWYLGNSQLTAPTGASAYIDIDVAVRTIADGEVSAPETRQVRFTFAVDSGRLEVSVADHFADITVDVRVAVNESSASVMKNLYPERWAVATATFDNLQIEWDDHYLRDLTACWRKYLHDRTPPVIPLDQRRPTRDRRPQYDQLAPTQLIRMLNTDDPRAAYSLAARVARELDVPLNTVLDDAFGEPETGI